MKKILIATAVAAAFGMANAAEQAHQKGCDH